MSRHFQLRFLAVLAVALAFAVDTVAENAQMPEKLGNIIGTVTDANGGTVPNATVVLEGPDAAHRRTVVTGDNGFFQFSQVKPGMRYQLRVTAKEFADWILPGLTLTPGQFKIVSNIQLRIETSTTVQVRYDPVEVATEQLHAQLKQRILGIVPNYFVSYRRDAEPLTPKLKFELAMKVATDPVTAAGVAIVSAAKQAGDTPKYGQGWDSYGKRVGATAADGFTDIIIGGAILPSLLHQDPRYFYQGTGTTGSRIRHAVFSPFYSKNDNGKWGPNYSSLGGDLASSALSNLYYPQTDRGVGLVFSQFAIGTAERIGASLAQEFLLSKLTKRGGHL
jgi:hypothetical protein